ncbi:hydroxymethylglutaryl-CoA reductase, degradative [Acidobacteriia bacterium AH_259_A11_L15]|nr:hydroxymethylglutaryl-CoA reductase, degradative [Acidobacteriia bacterium AH_259_A11_L15]
MREHTTSSEISGLYKLSVHERLEIVESCGQLTNEELETLSATKPLTVEEASQMLENVAGIFPLPLSIATHFRVNGRDRLVPMVTEEKSIVAGASYAAKLARSAGGFTASCTEPRMVGQVQIMNCPSPDEAERRVVREAQGILEKANALGGSIVGLGGGGRSLECKVLRTDRGSMLIVDITFDTRDAMGARFVTRACESVAPFLEEITGGRALAKIVSNFAVKRICKAGAVWRKDLLGDGTVAGILDVCEFAIHDKFRCVTHNKGIMNGIDAVAVATGNDFRAIEAAAHAFACREGRYVPLAKYFQDDDGNLRGEIEIPLPVGIVGGSTTNPVARICRKILGVNSVTELAEIMAAVGLAQNFAILRALVQEGLEGSYRRLSGVGVRTSQKT